MKIVKKSILRIAVFSLIIILNWAGISAIGRTFSYFNDTENTPGNTCQAGTLDFSLNAPGDFSLNFTSNDPAVRNISVINNGSLPFQYIIGGAGFSGPLCETLNLKAELNGENKYDGSLTGFVLGEPVIFSGTDNWQFIFSFSGDDQAYKDKPCQFYFDFKGWQDNAPNYESSGFKDEEQVSTHLMLRAEKTVVLNEILPNPIGEECDLQGLQGEWVEIYNNGDIEQDLTGWYIKNSEDDKIIIDSSNVMGGSTIIGPKDSGSEWLVVFLNGCILDNDGDAVFLYHSADSLADSYSYAGPAPENKSYARYPDGTGPWYDPIPTPGGPNILVVIQEEQPIPNDIFDIPTVDMPIVDEISGLDESSGEPILVTDSPDSLLETDSPQDSVVEETTPDEEINNEEQPTEEDQPVEEEPIIEEGPEDLSGSIIETITPSTEETVIIQEEEPVEEESTPEVLPEEPVVDEVSADEFPAVEEQPATVPDENPINVDGNGESDSGDGGDGGSSDDSPTDTVSEPVISE